MSNAEKMQKFQDNRGSRSGDMRVRVKHLPTQKPELSQITQCAGLVPCFSSPDLTANEEVGGWAKNKFTDSELDFDERRVVTPSHEKMYSSAAPPGTSLITFA